MNTRDMEKIEQALNSSNIDSNIIDETMYDIQFEAAVSTLEARLHGGYESEEIIADTLEPR